MSRRRENREIGFVLLTAKAKEAFVDYEEDMLIRFSGMRKKDFKNKELKGLVQGKDYKIMWS